jgi:N-acetylglutamate synthase-like GNAT family acetyltransferase
MIKTLNIINGISNEDKKDIIELLYKCFGYERDLNNYSKIIVYTFKNKIIGLVAIEKYYTENIVLSGLCVKEEYRTNGIATAIMRYVMYMYTEPIILYIDKNKKNTNYLKYFYKRLGFRELHEYIHFYPSVYINLLKYNNEINKLEYNKNMEYCMIYN